MELIKEIQSSCEADLFQPLHAYLRAKKSGQTTPPYIPHWDFMPLHKLCRLALLWDEVGFKEEAGQLAKWLLPLEKFFALWCHEKEFDEKENQKLFSLLAKIEPISGAKPNFDITLLNSGSMSAAITLSGNGTSLGMIRTSDVEIRAFGPQAASLNFGIKGRGMNGWTRCFAFPEVWFELKTECQESQCKLDLRFVGLKPENPLFFAFYVKAQSCQIGNEIFKPKCLRRFNGEASTVSFQKLKIESSLVHKIQVIPLAGEGCFWGCDFLVSFELHPLVTQTSFLIKI